MPLPSRIKKNRTKNTIKALASKVVKLPRTPAVIPRRVETPFSAWFTVADRKSFLAQSGNFDGDDAVRIILDYERHAGTPASLSKAFA